MFIYIYIHIYIYAQFELIFLDFGKWYVIHLSRQLHCLKIYVSNIIDNVYHSYSTIPIRYPSKIVTFLFGMKFSNAKMKGTISFQSLIPYFFFRISIFWNSYKLGALFPKVNMLTIFIHLYLTLFQWRGLFRRIGCFGESVINDISAGQTVVYLYGLIDYQLLCIRWK